MNIKEKVSLHKALGMLRSLLTGRHHTCSHSGELNACWLCEDNYELLRDAEAALEMYVNFDKV